MSQHDHQHPNVEEEEEEGDEEEDVVEGNVNRIDRCADMMPLRAVNNPLS